MSKFSVCHIRILSLFILLGLSLSACKKGISTDKPAASAPEPMVYPVRLLDSVSAINKTTSWYNTNRSFDMLFNVHRSLYWGFEQTANGLIPYNTGTSNTFSANKSYYWNDLGTYLFTDLTGDGYKDLWAYYWKSPWPTNATGLHLFSEYQLSPQRYDLQTGLVQVRKCVLADLNNDGFKEIVLFSSGYDGPPFPGDVIGIFYVGPKQYQYLNDDIGYFHGGATGDINNDGLIDIVAYSGGSMVIPVHPTAYLNRGNQTFELSNQLFKNFMIGGMDNYYTVELFDINKDGKLDLFLGSSGNLLYIPQKNGTYNRNDAILLPVQANLEIMDIAFFDFNTDGKLDVLTMSNLAGYQGYGMQLFLQSDSGFTDATSQFFNFYSGAGRNAWIKWIHLFDYDKDGDIDVVGDGLFGDLNGSQGRKIWWRNKGGSFIQMME